MIFDCDGFKKDLKKAYENSEVISLDELSWAISTKFKMNKEQKITRNHMKRLFNDPDKSRLSFSQIFLICEFFDIDIYDYVNT